MEQATRVESPLPGGIATIVRFLLQQVPQWVQIGGAILAVVVGICVVVVAWRRRRPIAQWLRTRRRGVQIGLAGAAGLMLVGVVGFSAASWNYIQHDNGFCTGCHVMNPAFQRFTRSEHDSLSCHDCHQQPLTASMRQLYLWVAERPERIGPHAKLADAVCERCHVTGSGEKKWQRVKTTAGHRTHLESDSSALRDIKCITCHGVELHRFKPTDSTCARANCHVNVKIRLAKMQDQTDLHCITCHQFTADVPRLATTDSATGTLVPSMKQCLSCHAMRKVLTTFDPARDPHKGTCGMCHNPHTQATPAEAAKTCTSAGCHATWRTEPFHTGANHRRVTSDCILCHQPHRAKVDATDCAGCHREVQGRQAAGRRVHPPLPFDTSRALRRVMLPLPAPHLRVAHGPRELDAEEDALPSGGFTGWPVTPPLVPRDTFSHKRHVQLACITCHTVRGSAGLTFERPRGCQICHHQAPSRNDCTRCHQADELAPARQATITVTVAGHAPRPRGALFEHAIHSGVACVTCHTEAVTLAPSQDAVTCASCHADHHAPARQCVTCHAVNAADVRSAHAPPVEAHITCDACHATTTVARLEPDRPMCITCHQPQREHYATRQCTTCHFQAEPAAFRHLLTRASS